MLQITLYVCAEGFFYGSNSTEPNMMPCAAAYVLSSSPLSVFSVVHPFITHLFIKQIWSCCGSQFFLICYFTKEYKENDHKWSFSYNSFVKWS